MFFCKKLEVDAGYPVVLAVKFVHLPGWIDPVGVAAFVISEFVGLAVLLGGNLVAFVAEFLVVFVSSVHHYGQENG